MLRAEGFKQCDVVGRVRRMRTEKRSLRVKGSAEGAASKSKNSGPRLVVADTPASQKMDQGWLNPQLFQAV